MEPGRKIRCASCRQTFVYEPQPGPTDRCAKKVTRFAEILLEIQDQMRCGRNLHCAAVSKGAEFGEGGPATHEESWDDAVKKAELEAAVKAAEQEVAERWAARLDAARLDAEERRVSESIAAERKVVWEESHGVEIKLDATNKRLDQIIELLNVVTRRLLWIALYGLLGIMALLFSCSYLAEHRR